MIEIVFEKLVLQIPESALDAAEYFTRGNIRESMDLEMERRGLNPNSNPDKRAFHGPIQDALATHSSPFVRMAVGSSYQNLAALPDDAIYNLLHDSDPRVRAATLSSKSNIPKGFDRVTQPELETMFSELLDSGNDEILAVLAASDRLPKFMSSQPAAVQKLLLQAPVEMVSKLIFGGSYKWDVLSRVADRGEKFAVIVVKDGKTKKSDDSKSVAGKLPIFRRLMATSDVAIRAEVASCHLFTGSDEFREVCKGWLLQEPVEVIRGLMIPMSEFRSSLDQKLLLECASRGDEFAFAVVQHAFFQARMSPASDQSEILTFLVQHRSAVVREFMARSIIFFHGDEIKPLGARLLEKLAQDQDADVANTAKQTMKRLGV